MVLNNQQSRNSLYAAIFLAPFLILYFLFMLLPLLEGLYISLHDWTKIKKIAFVSLQNYCEMLTDKHFGGAFGNTTLFVAISTPAIIFAAFALAFVCNQPSRLKTFYRSVFFLPQVLSVSVVCSLFMLMFRPYVGLINSSLQSFGLMESEIIWFGKDAGLSWFFIILRTLWWTVGFSMLLFLAGLQDIPISLYEAAQIDGASRCYQLLHITIPILHPVTSVIVMLQVINSYKLFSQVWLTTRGGPGSATRPVIQYIYQTGFIDNRIGYASAISYFFLLFLLILAFLINKVTKHEST